MTTDQLQVRVNGRLVTVRAGTVVAAAIARAGVTWSRRSVLGQPRAPLCGMGVCMECRVRVQGQTQVRGCLVLCTDGMEVVTDE